jgi:hypothetical protein
MGISFDYAHFFFNNVLEGKIMTTVINSRHFCESGDWLEVISTTKNKGHPSEKIIYSVYLRELDRTGRKLRLAQLYYKNVIEYFETEQEALDAFNIRSKHFIRAYKLSGLPNYKWNGQCIP